MIQGLILSVSCFALFGCFVVGDCLAGRAIGATLQVENRIFTGGAVISAVVSIVLIVKIVSGF